MTAMFPDSGVPWTDARNSLPSPSIVNCNPLWYSTSRCKPRFDPAAANAMLSELLNLINRGEVVYDCNRLDNIERAARYLVQRGLPRYAVMTGGPQNYAGVLDPGATRYNDGMTLTVVPLVSCVAGPINFDAGLGPRWILRNDDAHLEAGDLLHNEPTIIAFYNNAWHFVGLAASQVPIVKKGGIDCWIRTDGNDITGDGTANTPDKAFKTIAGCWNAVGSRYAATPLFSINMKLGIPGDYAGTAIGPFGGSVSLLGDHANPAAYRIVSAPWGLDGEVCFWAADMARMIMYGVTLAMDYNGPRASTGLIITNSNLSMQNCNIEVLVPNTRGVMLNIAGGRFSGYSPGGTIRFIGHNHAISICISCSEHGSLVGAFLELGQTQYYYFTDINAANVMQGCGGLSTMHWSGATGLSTSGCVGPEYNVSENSIIHMNGLPLFGTPSTGVVSSGGVFIA